ncbi:MAG: hypothetical protein LBG96_17620 [Tannerella sp.]|jgi:hypothetical protein|nr:hypothetical protein [Tannerella sp.]
MKKTIFICLMFISVAVMGQEKKTVWDYPVKPGMKEWQDCNSPEEIYEMLQVPEDILKKIDTKSLIQICLNYPAPTIFYIFNTPQQGFEGFYRQFNGIRELMSRKDAGYFLIEKYADMSLDGFSPLWTLENQGAYINKFYYIELFLVQPVILNLLSKSERKVLLIESLKKFDLKDSQKDLFGSLNRSATVRTIARTLYVENRLTVIKTNSLPDTIVASLESGQLVNIDVQSVYQQAKLRIHE